MFVQVGALIISTAHMIKQQNVFNSKTRTFPGNLEPMFTQRFNRQVGSG